MRPIYCYRRRPGRCRLGQWYEELRARDRARVDRILSLLAGSSDWSAHFKMLRGSHLRGIGEIIIPASRAYRLLGCERADGAGFVILLGCYHKDKVYVPHATLDTVLTIRAAYFVGEGSIHGFEEVFAKAEE
jgi:hypothetical protein